MDKKAAINAINKKDNKCFQQAVIAPSNFKEIKRDLQKITKIKLFMNEYNWEKINYLSEKDDWKIKTTIAFNVLYAKREKNLSCLFSKTTKIVKDKLSF